MKPATDISEFPHGVAVLPPLVDRSARPRRERPRATPTLLRDYYELTKPRMNLLVVLTTLLGYYAAPSAGPTSWLRVFNTVLATALTAAGAAVLNQYIEREHDRNMRRTEDRCLPAGRVPPLHALTFGVLLGAAGMLYLALAVNPLTAILGGATLASYIFVYTPMKRWTTLCTIVGAIPGAIPPVMGWTAVTNSISVEAMLLFGILFLWQMPHFLAIAVMYERDYTAGGFKMLPCVDPGYRATARQIVVYLLALMPISLMPFAMRMAGPGYLVTAVVLGLAFLGYGIRAAMSRTREDARKLFFVSIIYLPVLLIALVIDKT